MKKCIKCNDVKELNQFRKAKYCTHGVSDVCKACFTPSKRVKKKPQTELDKRYYRYKIRSKKHNRLMDLSVEDFESLLTQSCYYCGHEHNLTIDRIDSNIGYIKSNCVPCCLDCNIAKGSKTYNEFINWLERCYNHPKLPL